MTGLSGLKNWCRVASILRSWDVKGEELGGARGKGVRHFKHQLHLLGQLPWRPGAEVIKQQDDDKENSQSHEKETSTPMLIRTSALERLRQEDEEFQTVLDYRVRCCLKTNKQIN